MSTLHECFDTFPCRTMQFNAIQCSQQSHPFPAGFLFYPHVGGWCSDKLFYKRSNLAVVINECTWENRVNLGLATRDYSFGWLHAKQ